MADYFTDAGLPEMRALKTAFLKALDLAESDMNKSMVIAIQDAESLHNEVFDSMLGKDFIRTLQEEGNAEYGEVTVYLQTEDYVPEDFKTGPMFASHLTLGLLSNLEESTSATHLIFMPTSEEEMEKFRKTHPSAHMI